MTRVLQPIAAIAFATLLSAQAPTVTTVQNNGSTQTRYDMVILGDGYQIQEQNRFNQDVTTFLAALFQTQPYQTFAAYYNVHTVFRASIDSGADHPDVTPPIYKNTVYNASYNTGGTARCLYIGNTSQALADAALAPATEGRVLVMVNDSRYGGCAGTFAVSYNGSSMAQVQIHEIGHSLGQLADEYDYPNTTYTGNEPSQANITKSPTGAKWTHWSGTGGISAFEGAGYYLYGLYRPKNNCLMRTLGVSLCAVCQEQISRVTNSICQAISQSSPTASNLVLSTGATQMFSFTHYVPPANGPTIQWKVDGAVVPAANTTTFTFNTAGVALGQHTIEGSVQDHSPLVRQDPNLTMRHSRSWTVSINNPAAAQLRVPVFQASQVWVNPGTTVTLSTTVINDGPAAAGTFAVEYFLTTSQPWTSNDVYLGRDTVNGLAMAQQTSLQRQVTLPWRMANGLHYCYAVVDRLNVVPEVNENDNAQFTALIGQTGPCVTKLEYADPLLYPFDAHTVSTGSGGAVHPTVVARCATPGTLYLIAWGCSGTTPGTLVAPGVTVPINQDFCTQLGLSAINGPWFQAFLGTLDAQGLGHATFALPPASGLWPSTGHFAALLVDPALGFAGVSNPVTITIGL